MSSGAVIRLRRGRLLTPRGGAAHPFVPDAVGTDAVEQLKLLALIGVLPMFGQSFHYLIDVGPIYLLSKAWPFLTLPLVVYCLMRTALPMTAPFLVMLGYVLGVTPLLSMVQLDNGFFDALATTVKAWPLAYYFSLTGALLLLAPQPRTVERSLFILGAATFLIMIALWFAIPLSWYASDAKISKFLIYETERGYRIYMPMFLGTLFLFMCTRYGMASARRRWLLLVIPLAIVALLMIYKQRAAIAGTVAIVGLGVFLSLPTRWRLLGAAGALACVVIGLFVVVSGVLSSGVSEHLGSSLSIRQQSFGLAVEYVAQDLLRLVFGVGSITRHSSVTMADLFGDARFYLADIGWAGILFEYGVVGTLLIAAVHVTALVIVLRNARLLGDPLSAALGDYVIYIILTSSIYSVMFVPGELVTVTALSLYLVRHRAGPAPPAA